MRPYWLIGLLLCAPSAQGDELEICHNYGCDKQTKITLEKKQLSRIAALFKATVDAPGERQAIAHAVGLMETFAGERSLTWQDKGRNWPDGSGEGRMDCIDNAYNTDLYLRLFERHGWFKYHRVLEKVERGILARHWGAQIEDLQTGNKYVVDSWFYDNGQPALIFGLKEWLDGAKPDE
jgi:hypothetical protein